jgi:hypothetical protein
MANICDNSFYAQSSSEANLDAIEKFFDAWEGLGYDVDEKYRRDDELEYYFESKWVFPESDMDKLFNSIPDKNDIFMRCLSVDYGERYHALWFCEDENGWYEE